ncbi:hypothetical protein COOONC_04962 [Cooperia oncophora]
MMFSREVRSIHISVIIRVAIAELPKFIEKLYQARLSSLEDSSLKCQGQHLPSLQASPARQGSSMELSQQPAKIPTLNPSRRPKIPVCIQPLKKPKIYGSPVSRLKRPARPFSLLPDTSNNTALNITVLTRPPA